MRIRLKNFRCYEDNTFDLGDNGITLITAPSGYGKSTILNGIHFALFGVGNKVTSFGKTSCLVELDFDDLKIVRTKRPNRLVVNEIYEDEVAQQLINNKFGENFDVTGYISQNAMNSFIMMNPMEKLSFLERFAFKDIDLNDIKSRCKANITKTHDELIANESQLQLARKIIEEIKKPDENIKFPIKCKKSQIELAIKNENVRFKNCITLITKAQNNIVKKEKELNSIHILNSIISTRTESIDSIHNKIIQIEKQIENIDINFIDENNLEEHKRSLSTLLLQKELIDIETMFDDDTIKLNNMKIQEEAEYKSALEKINNELWHEFKSDELIDTLESLTSSLNDIEKIANIKKELNKYNSINSSKLEENERKLNSNKQEFDLKNRLLSRLKLQKELYSCPSCNVKLRLVKNSLCLENNTDTDIDLDMSTITNQVNQLNTEINILNRSIENDRYKLKLKNELETTLSELINSYDDLPEKDNIINDINYLKEYQIEQRNLEKKKKSIDDSIQNCSFSSSYNSFKNNVLALERQLVRLKSKHTTSTSTSMTENELRELIQTETDSINLHKRLNTNKTELLKEQLRYENFISIAQNEHITKYNQITTDSIIENEINTFKNEIQNIQIKKEEHSENLTLIDEWKRSQTDIENYKQWKERITSLESDCEITRQKHVASTMLKEKILEAESIALLNIIDTINTHTQLYLEAFFPDDPITITLQTFKETKKNTKPSINLAIEYKGMECELNMLSGGELSRVILAYTLALGEIFNTPLLMLDESTASLDQLMTGCVFDGIKEHFNGKLVIIIAHQIVEGGFDRVINLNKEDK
jgi:exonuclease SbcC